MQKNKYFTNLLVNGNLLINGETNVINFKKYVYIR